MNIIRVWIQGKNKKFNFKLIFQCVFVNYLKKKIYFIRKIFRNARKKNS